MIRNFLLICLLGCGISLATAGNPPFFTTGTAVNEKGELLMTQKGTRQLDVFAADGKTLLRSYPFKETPTGVLLDGDKAYVTTFEKTGRLEVLSLKSGQIEAAIPTGSGACYPIFSADKKHIYVCNQFAGTVSEIDPATCAGIVCDISYERICLHNRLLVAFCRSIWHQWRVAVVPGIRASHSHRDGCGARAG